MASFQFQLRYVADGVLPEYSADDVDTFIEEHRKLLCDGAMLHFRKAILTSHMNLEFAASCAWKAVLAFF